MTRNSGKKRGQSAHCASYVCISCGSRDASQWYGKSAETRLCERCYRKKRRAEIKQQQATQQLTDKHSVGVSRDANEVQSNSSSAVSTPTASPKLLIKQAVVPSRVVVRIPLGSERSSAICQLFPENKQQDDDEYRQEEDDITYHEEEEEEEEEQDVVEDDEEEEDLVSNVCSLCSICGSTKTCKWYGAMNARKCNACYRKSKTNERKPFSIPPPIMLPPAVASLAAQQVPIPMSASSASVLSYSEAALASLWETDLKETTSFLMDEGTSHAHSVFSYSSDALGSEDSSDDVFLSSPISSPSLSPLMDDMLSPVRRCCALADDAMQQLHLPPSSIVPHIGKFHDELFTFSQLSAQCVQQEEMILPGTLVQQQQHKQEDDDEFLDFAEDCSSGPSSPSVLSQNTNFVMDLTSASWLSLYQQAAAAASTALQANAAFVEAATALEAVQPNNNAKLCLNCGRQPIHARGRCGACFKYLRTKGIERPARLYEKARKKKSTTTADSSPSKKRKNLDEEDEVSAQRPAKRIKIV